MDKSGGGEVGEEKKHPTAYSVVCMCLCVILGAQSDEEKEKIRNQGLKENRADNT